MLRIPCKQAQGSQNTSHDPPASGLFHCFLLRFEGLLVDMGVIWVTLRDSVVPQALEGWATRVTPDA